MGTLPIEHFKNQKGQALLLVLLAMSVVLVLGLSIVSRTVTDLSNTTRQEESTRAFNAAESGVEKALLIGGSTAGSVGAEGATFNATINAGSASTDFNYPLSVPSGDMAHLWFLNHDASGNYTCSGNSCFAGDPLRINFCWGNVGAQGANPAAEIIIFYTDTPGNYSTVRTWKRVYDPNLRNPSFLPPDPGSPGTCVISNKPYTYQKVLSLGSGVGGLLLPTQLQGNLLFAKVRLLYNTTPQDVGFRVTAGPVFPPQGNKVSSTGTAGNANRRLEVTQLFGEPPAIFHSLIYSATGVTHN